jgi:diacylglycerol kinase family enzyme
LHDRCVLPDSRSPIFVVLNSISGREDGDETARTVDRVLREAGRPHEILRVDDATQIESTASRAVEAARAAQGCVVAAGGDGTLNAVARATLGSGLPYGVIPQGTFNYFARSHGIATTTAEATRGLLEAQVRRVPVGLVNGRPFLVNASVGLYPEALELREEQKQRHGRSRAVALWATLIAVLRDHDPMRIRLEGRDRAEELATLTLFVGVNRLQLEQMGWNGEPLEEGWLAGIVLRPVSTPRLLWLMLRGAAGRLPHAAGVDSFLFSKLTVTPRGNGLRRIKVATDGETTLLTPPLRCEIAPEPLLLLAPQGATGPTP